MASALSRARRPWAAQCSARSGLTDLLIRHVSIISCSWSLLCKLDMEQHCKWIVHGAAGFRGRLGGCTRMRPKLHLPVLGHVLRASGVMPRSCQWLVRHLEGCVVTHRSIQEQLDTSPSISRRQRKLPCDSHGLILRPSNIPDLTWPVGANPAGRGRLVVRNLLRLGVTQTRAGAHHDRRRAVTPRRRRRGASLVTGL